MAAPRPSAARRTKTGMVAIACRAHPLARRYRARTINNDLFSHEDMLPTLLAAAGVPDVKEQLLKGMKVGDKTFKVHLDGYNITDPLAGKGENPRKEFFYWNDDGSLVGLRYDHGRSSSRTALRRLRRLAGSVRAAALPELFNLRSDRSRGPTSASVTRNGESTALPARAGAAVCREVHRSSGNSRRARRSAASHWTRCWKNSLRRARAEGRGTPLTTAHAFDDRQPESAAGHDIAAAVKDFYERYSISSAPSTISTSIDGAGRIGNPAPRRLPSLLARTSRSRKRAQLFSSPAAEHRRQPSTLRAVLEARVVGIDFSATSVRHTEDLRRKYSLTNLEVHQVVDRSGSANWR